MARYSRSKRTVQHPQGLVWSKMSGSLLKMSTFQPGEIGGGGSNIIWYNKPVKLQKRSADRQTERFLFSLKYISRESFFLPAGKSARIYLLVLCFGGSRGQKAGKKKDGAGKKAGKNKYGAGKKRKKRIRNNGVRQDLYQPFTQLIYSATIAPLLPSIKSPPTFAAIRRHLPLSAAVHSTLPSVAVVRLLPLSAVQRRSPPSSTHCHHPPPPQRIHPQHLPLLTTPVLTPKVIFFY